MPKCHADNNSSPLRKSRRASETIDSWRRLRTDVDEAFRNLLVDERRCIYACPRKGSPWISHPDRRTWESMTPTMNGRKMPSLCLDHFTFLDLDDTIRGTEEGSRLLCPLPDNCDWSNQVDTDQPMGTHHKRSRMVVTCSHRSREKPTM